jgi:hypothetical protein
MNGVERSNDGVTLRKCPFCGTRLTNEKPSKLYVHEKTGCILDLRAFTEDQLGEWNTRKSVERILERLEKEYDINNWGKPYGISLDKVIEIIKEEVG